MRCWHLPPKGKIEAFIEDLTIHPLTLWCTSSRDTPFLVQHIHLRDGEFRRKISPLWIASPWIMGLILREWQNMLLNKIYICFTGLVGRRMATTLVSMWWSIILDLSPQSSIQSTITNAMNSKKCFLTYSHRYATLRDVVNTTMWASWRFWLCVSSFYLDCLYTTTEVSTLNIKVTGWPITFKQFLPLPMA